MVNLGQLSVSDSYAQTSGSGFGTRALCRRLERHSDAPVRHGRVAQLACVVPTRSTRRPTLSRMLTCARRAGSWRRSQGSATVATSSLRPPSRTMCPLE